MEKWRIKIVHLVYFGFILSLVVFMSIGCGGGSSGRGSAGGGSGTTNPTRINDATPTAAQDASITFNSAGDAMAVWISNNGGHEHRLLYSFFTQATDTWSDDSELGTTFRNPVVCSDGTDFMVVWSDNNIIAREYIVSSGTWGPETIIESQTYTPNDPHVASNGAGYCVVWSQPTVGPTRIYANIYNGSTWGTETAVGSASGSAYSPKVASNGTGYCVTWPRDDSGTNNIYASIYTTGPSWSAETSLEAIAGYADPPQIASDGAGYCVTWEQYDGALDSIYANVYSGAWGGATLIESNDSYDARSPKIASDGTGYGVAWLQSDVGTYERVYVNGYDTAGASWSTEIIIDSGIHNCSDIGVASNGSGYAVTWLLYDSGTDNVLARIYDRVTDWDTETLLESGSGEANNPYIASDGTGYCTIWTQDDGTRNTVYANLNSGSGWGTETNLMQSQYHGSIMSGIRFASNNAGDVLAIWRQYDDDMSYLFGRLYSGGGWGAVFEIFDHLTDYDVSSDGVEFMIVIRDYQFGRIYAVPYDTTTGLGTEEQISGNSTNNCRISSNGTGYCATWMQNNDIYANLYDGSDWTDYLTLTPLDTGSGYSVFPQVASNGTGYCVTWFQDDGLGTNDIWVRIHDGSSWDPAATIESDSNEAFYPQIASDGTGYCVTWEQNNSIYANIYEGSPLAWGTATLVEIGSGWVDLPQVASNGSTYGVTWHQYDGSAPSIFVNLYDGSWGTEITIESGSGNAYDPHGASNGTGYCVSWVQNDGTANSVYANTFDGSTWGTEQVIESSDTEVNGDWGMWPVVVAAQDTYTIGWLQEDVNDPLIDNAWVYSGLSD